VRSLPDLPVDLIIAQAFDPWVWAYTNEIRLVGATFAFKGHEFQAEPMQVDTRLVTVRKAAQMAFTEGAVLKVLHAVINRKWPVGCLYLFPKQDTVTDFSASRFNPLIRDNPVTIGQYVPDTNRANLKRIGDGFLYFRSGCPGRAKTTTHTFTLKRSLTDNTPINTEKPFVHRERPFHEAQDPISQGD
jgi:hypothetical protein